VTKRNRKPTGLTAVDICCGAGGVTTGFKAAGLRVTAALDFDENARESYALNHPRVKLLEDDLLQLAPRGFLRKTRLRKGEIDVLTACVPCQPYSSLGAAHKCKDDPRYRLVGRIGDFVKTLAPRALVMENVPGLVFDVRFTRLVGRLRRMSYGVWYGIVNASEFGVPQTRRRLVLIAIRDLRDGDVPPLTPTHPALKALDLDPGTVRDVLTSVKVAQLAEDPLHQRRTTFRKKTVATRIANIPKNGGDRKDLPRHLRLQCHRELQKAKKSGSRNVYGRMVWNALAPTLTTRCVTPACGRFLHPEENRPITLREAAALQTFPLHYQFAGGTMAVQAQIGNAVPPALAKAVALVVRHALASAAHPRKEISL
jgi:DNA (cytosine-5)-methyltransferase 1